jgi:subtilisin family serine protease
MRYFKTNRRFLNVAFILLSFIFTPIIGIGLINANHSSQINENLPYDLNPIISQIDNQINSRNNELESQNPKDDHVFDEKLKTFLKDLSHPKECNPKYVKIIITFDVETNKQERINLIDSILNDYKVLYNYDIIPGVAIEVDSLELNQKASFINDVLDIQKIYKSNNYEPPVIIDKSLKPSDLSKGSYDNWWVKAVGADNVGGLTGNGVKVSVIDTGVFDHPDLNYNPSSTTARNLISEEADASNYDDSYGHGTHVAGIIGSSGAASGGLYRGIAPGVEIINARTGDEGGFSDPDLVASIEWSVDTAKADIISMSLGGDFPFADDPVTIALRNASNQGVIVVVAAGNSGPGYFTGGSPGSGTDLITVGATDSNNKLASFSSWGPTASHMAYPDVVAPGVNIISTDAKDTLLSAEMRYIGDIFDFTGDADYIPLSGTSMATPVVSGAVAILKQKYPSLTPETARIALVESAKKLADERDSYFTRSGAGLINITAALAYLDNINTTFADVNNTAIYFPGELPFEPYDLLNFPGDHMKYNITIISGKDDTYNITIPNVPSGLTLTLDKSQITFTDAGVGFVELDIKINKDAQPGITSFLLNLSESSGGAPMDFINASFEIRLPEYKILMESFHGLNDINDVNATFPLNQMGFYEAMQDLTELNISIDYGMQYWTPDYDFSTDNSILTEERLAQYDLVVLQNPILPYSPVELSAFIDYFNNGGNILLLGTRYQELASESINRLLALLDVDIQINDENVMNVEYYSTRATIYSQSVTSFNSPAIFNGVNKYLWYYGNTFSVSAKANTIATLSGKSIAAAYNGSSYGKGNLIAFGNLDWIHSDYTRSSYYSDHSKLLTNLMGYLLPSNDYSLTIGLRSERIAGGSELNITIYAKNQTTDTPITSGILNSNLTVTVEHPTQATEFISMSSSNNGIASNYLYTLPAMDYSPYYITVNLTIGSINYTKTSKVLYYNSGEVPNINSLYSSSSSIPRTGSTVLTANIGALTHDVDSYIALYSNSFFNSHKTVNKTLNLADAGVIFQGTFNPSISDPSGIAIYYVVVNRTGTSYINPNSPRSSFNIQNSAPQINEETSIITMKGRPVKFSATHTVTSVSIYTSTQGDSIEFSVVANDGSNEDSTSQLRVDVTLYIASILGNTIYLNLIPNEVEVSRLTYTTSGHTGTYTIPKTLQFSTISGQKAVSSVATYDPYDPEAPPGYVGAIVISVVDSEGASDTINIYTIVEELFEGIPIELILLIIGIALIGIVIVVVVVQKRKRKNLKY